MKNQNNATTTTAAIDFTKYETAKNTLAQLIKDQAANEAAALLNKGQQAKVYGDTRKAIASDINEEVESRKVSAACYEALALDSKKDRSRVSEWWIVYRMTQIADDGALANGLSFSAAVTLSKSANLGDALANGDTEAVSEAVSKAIKAGGTTEAIRAAYKSESETISEPSKTERDALRKATEAAFLKLYDELPSQYRDSLRRFAEAAALLSVYNTAAATQAARLTKAAETAKAAANEAGTKAATLSDEVVAAESKAAAIKAEVEALAETVSALESEATKAAELHKTAVGTPFEAVTKAAANEAVKAAEAAAAELATKAAEYEEATKATKAAAEIATKAAKDYNTLKAEAETAAQRLDTFKSETAKAAA